MPLHLNNFYTYLYFDPSRNEPIYVGKGKDKRFNIHLSRKDMHPLTHRLQMMKRNGVQPIITFLCRNIDEELALLIEQEAISKYGRKDLGKGPLLNLTDGGEGSTGWKMPDKTKEKIALKAKARPPQSEETRQKKRVASAKRVGWHHTEESKAKSSASKIGKKKPIGFGELRSKMLSKPCTVDGITIYPSRDALKKALGHNKNGDCHPNFRYINGK